MTPRTIQVRVPATVGNFCGVSTSTVALDGTLNVRVTLRSDGGLQIRYFGENGERVPRERSNLVVRAMESALASKGIEFSGADFEIYSAVPVGVGLGSSAAAVLAGVVAADRLARLKLDEKLIFELAAVHEARLENTRAAWFGGLVSADDGDTPEAFSETSALDVVIPQFERLNTPFASGSDKQVPGLEEALAIRLSGVSIFRCGAGPAVGIVDRELRAEAVKLVRDCFARRGVESRSIVFHPSRCGARDWNREGAAVGSLPGYCEEPARKPTLIPV